MEETDELSTGKNADDDNGRRISFLAPRPGKSLENARDRDAIVEEGPRCRKSLRIMRHPDSSSKTRRGEMTRCFSANRLVPSFQQPRSSSFQVLFRGGL